MGKGACSELMISIMKNERFQYVRINDYQIEEDKPDILILNHPYDIFSDIKDCRRHCRLIIAASMQLIRYTYDWNDFWHMQQKSFGRFYPDYYLFDSLLYNDMRRAGYISDRIIEMGNAKFDGIYKACQNKSYPPEWDKLKQKKVILWMTDHGVHDGGITQEVSFDIYAGSIFRYALDNPEIGIIFRPHSVLISELLKTGLWTEKDIETLKGYCLKSENIVYDDTLTYDNAFSIADGIITDAFCGITCSSLPTLKPICLTYRNKYDKPFHKELEDCCYSARNEKELLEFMDIVRDDRDTMMELRKKALSKCVKHFDGNNGYRIKEFIKKKYKESVS
ncbi:MAG: hypothetical protein J6D08_09180 [Lachnospiraceae bacterium]|nr:hypothetical protein [Lachnospiraceae bacterium]